jgi:hypothetical protein
MKIFISDILWGEIKSDVEIRMNSLVIANDRFIKCRNGSMNQLGNKIDQHTVLFIKGFGNNPELMSCYRELMFNSRELLDYLLISLNRNTKNTGIQTNKSFVPFCKAMMANSYDGIDMELIQFLKTNITFIFHVRKVRNEIKNRISNIKFRLVTNHLESHFRAVIASDEKALIPFLDIDNKDEAIANAGYYCTFNLDLCFPAMVEFWKTALNIYRPN